MIFLKSPGKLSWNSYILTRSPVFLVSSSKPRIRRLKCFVLKALSSKTIYMRHFVRCLVLGFEWLKIVSFRFLLYVLWHFNEYLSLLYFWLQGSVWSLNGMCKQSNHDYFVEFLTQTFRMRQIAFKMRGYEIDPRGM